MNQDTLYHCPKSTFERIAVDECLNMIDEVVEVETLSWVLGTGDEPLGTLDKHLAGLPV